MISSKTLDYWQYIPRFSIKLFFISLVNGKLNQKYLILLPLILLNSFLPVQGQLSSDTKISILTCAPGDELYSIFGHSAIRIKDTVNDVDYVFNYGTFDFNTPNFYLKFMRGQLNYMLSVSTYDRFLFEYIYDKRSVWEQQLELSDLEKNNLYRALIINAEPENRYYHYHFFFDNCATRIRDMAADHVTGRVQFGRIPEQSDKKMSYRQAIASYLIYKPWTKLGLDILLGQPTDHPVDARSIQFLPDYLMLQFQGAIRKSDEKPIVNNTVTILDFNKNEIRSALQPDYLLWLAALIITLITWISYKKQKSNKWLDVILFTTTGVLGLLITFLWFFTEHTVTGPNWHLLWANPLHLFMIFGTSKVYTKFKPIYYLILAGVLITTLFFYIMPQFMPWSLLPLWLILCVRLALPVLRH